MSAKILALGPPKGSLASFVAKQRTLQAKHSFSLCVSVGDFFGGSQTTPDQEQELDDLLAGRLDVPLTTYIMLGSHLLPPKVQERVASTGGEVCSNVFFIGKSGVLTTSEGVKIGAVGGDFDEQLWEAETKKQQAKEEDEAEETVAPSTTHLTLSPSLLAPILASPHLFLPSGAPVSTAAPSLASFKSASVATGLDILLLHAPPPSLALLSPSFGKLENPHAVIAKGASPLADLMRRARPRYVFWDASGAPGGATNDAEDAFWEREPFGWEGPGMQGRYTRAIKIGAFGGPPAPEGKKKARSFYAFSLSPLPISPPYPAKPPNLTPNPISLGGSGGGNGRGVKRDAPLESQGFIWGAQSGGAGAKKPKQEHGVGDVPPPSYICKICNESGHYIRECPQKVARMADNEGGALRKPRELGPAECWFCLSNPKVTKHLIVSIGTETYTTLPKGQLPPTVQPGKLVQNKITGVPELPAGASEEKGPKSLVPGGGHVLVIPISHYPTLAAIPKEDAGPIKEEIDRTKEALKKTYAEYGCVPVAFEVGRVGGRGGHAHVQVIPIPKTSAHLVEPAFRDSDVSFESSDDDEAIIASAGGPNASYFRVDLPDGRKLVHLMRPAGPRFDLQFGRNILAGILGVPHRADWKACAAQTDAEEKADAAAFKQAFNPFNPFA